MRNLAFILATIIAILAFKPGIDHLFFQCDSEISCCTDLCEPFAIEEEKTGEENKEDCNGNSCNPFQSCCTSVAPSVSSIDYSFQNLLVSTERNFNYQFNIHSQFLSDFWQPPQAV